MAGSTAPEYVATTRVRQRELVAGLERDGHDTAEAIRLLTSFEKLQVLHIADRDRLRRELDAYRSYSKPHVSWDVRSYMLGRRC